MSTKPTLIFVAGAWYSTETWSKVIKLLEAEGFKCIPVGLPTTTGDASVSFGDDFKVVREAIIGETSQKRNVVLVVHSYGGAVGQSAIRDLTRPTDKQSGYVIGLVMTGSGFGQTGKTFMDNLEELFYHDLPEEEGEYWVNKLLPQSSKALTEGAEYAYAGWLDVPVWYLMTMEDKALPIEVQRTMGQAVRDAGAKITMREVESSHSPMLSKPKETVETILEAVASFV
ncbi:alpha beta-Hydrolase protein [Rutstroemia sp. NJR-2017a BBW]|nr:alpha beta-Hydrolase protein [Rutstroemia sp. NJR-2017a BBW]